tara:strand:+ start:3539 stop:4366 length:828 start_codon:yes stop_codon:yes gene_type:complete
MKNLYYHLMHEFKPEHISNKMKNEGDVVLARKIFLSEKKNNLKFLLYKRFNWMNHYIKKGSRVIDLGSGAGLIEFFIKEKILLTDIKMQKFIHKKIDALNIDLPDNSVDVFICTHMIHHISHPVKFLKSLEKKLVDGGLILIQDINTSFFMRVLLYLMKHEGFSYNNNIFDESKAANNSNDPWAANCAIPQLLFQDSKLFEKKVPLKILKNSLNEFLLLPFSGGVIAKYKTIQLPIFVLKLIDLFDRIMIYFFPKLFAFGRSVVLKKESGSNKIN